MPAHRRIKRKICNGCKIWVKEYRTLLPETECYIIINKFLPPLLNAKLQKHPSLAFMANLYHRLRIPLGCVDFQKAFSVLLDSHPNVLKTFGLFTEASNLGAVLAIKLGELDGKPLLYEIDPKTLPKVFDTKKDGPKVIIKSRPEFVVKENSNKWIAETEIKELRKIIKSGGLLVTHIEHNGLWVLCEFLLYDSLELLRAIISGDIPSLEALALLNQVRKKLSFIREKTEEAKKTSKISSDEKLFVLTFREAVMYLTNLCYRFLHIHSKEEEYKTKVQRLLRKCRKIRDPVLLNYGLFIDRSLTRLFNREVSGKQMEHENETLHLFSNISELLTYVSIADHQTKLGDDKKLKLFCSHIENAPSPDLAKEKLQKIFNKRYSDIKLVFGAHGFLGEKLERKLFSRAYVSDALIAILLADNRDYNGHRKDYKWVLKECHWAKSLGKKVVVLAEEKAIENVAEISDKECVPFNLRYMELDAAFLKELDVVVNSIRKKVAEQRLLSFIKSLQAAEEYILHQLLVLGRDEKFVTTKDLATFSSKSRTTVLKHIKQLREISSSLNWNQRTPLVRIVRTRGKNLYCSNVKNFIDATFRNFSCAEVDDTFVKGFAENLLDFEFETEHKPQISKNALQVLQKRYLIKDEKGNIIETPGQMFRRVANAVACAGLLYDEDADVDSLADKFYQIMSNLEFLPNSPTLMNAATRLGQLSACFILPINDSLKDIFETLEHMSLIQQSGGGTGFSFSRLRPKNDFVMTTMGKASGPVSFMRVFDVSTDVIKQGGKRRGANIGILSVTHPDIPDFIRSKLDGALTNFNISVAVTDDFMAKLERNEDYSLVNPRTNEPVERLPARKVFDLMVSSAWKTGDPGIVFIDEINRHNPTPHIGNFESTNPCGEQPLLPYESCNLGSIDVSKFVKDNDVDWEKLRRVIHLAVRFLDNVIDVNKYPLPQIEKMTKGNRKIGLGIMGFADLLVKLRKPYNSEEAVNIAENLMKFISEEAKKESIELALSKGSFPNFEGSLWERMSLNGIRNATLTTIAPTGTISIIAGCSSGIEPLFAVVYFRNVLNGTKMLEVNPEFERIAKERDFYSEELIKKVSREGSIQHIEEILEDVKKIFVTAHDISPEWHVRIQAAFQKHCDNAVSKTVNLPHNATYEDVERVFKLAYELHCKGITVYRYGSLEQQVLELGSDLANYVIADSEYSGGCPKKSCPF